MDKLRPEQRLQVVETFYQNNGSAHVFCPFYDIHNRSSEQLIRKLWIVSVPRLTLMIMCIP